MKERPTCRSCYFMRVTGYTIMLGYQPPILIKPVIALNKEARSAVLEELKIVPTSTDYIAITVNMEGGADHE